MDLFGWEDKDEDLAFAQDASAPGQFVQQWRLRAMAPEAALKEIANSKLRRLLAFNKSFNCADIEIGETVLFYMAQSKKGAPRWRGPVLILGSDGAGVTLKFQSQVF